MKTSDFTYDLPEELIALEPLPERSASRLLCMDRETGQMTHRHFTDIVDFISPGDLLVFNNSKVIPARLYGKRETGGKTKFLIARVLTPQLAKAHLKANITPKIGETLYLSDGSACKLEGREDSYFILRLFDTDKSWHDIMGEVGEMPLPPYIERPAEESDRARYQTIYAAEDKAASVAAPTAGLHFDEALLQRLKDNGVQTGFVTLHVGAGTFQPLRTSPEEDPRNHTMHSEYIEVSQDICDRIAQTRAAGNKVIAVGTTAVRSLESAKGQAYTGETDIFITPGYDFTQVDAMITNFHLPGTTLLMLVSAFAGRESILGAYAEAIEKKYRFFSYGDAMFLS